MIRMIGPKIQVKTDIRLSLAQQQSLLMLALPLAELREYLAEQLQDYPLLEVKGLDTPRYEGKGESFAAPWNEEREEGEGFVLPSRPETFREHLLFQLSALPLQEGVRRLCIYLIHSLSPRGYLTESEGEIAALTGESLSAVRQAVKIVQSLSPTGVGARDLVQCLLLQMEAKKITHPAPVAIVRDHLQDLARGHYGVIRKKLGLSAEETERWCRLIRTLNPIPSNGYFSGENVGILLPEGAIGPDLQVEMNQRDTPQVVMEEEYQKMLEQLGEEESRGYLIRSQQQARALTGQIARRQQTLQRLLQCLCTMQPDYFRHGPQALRPMTMGQVAEQLSLHESTVSRAVAGKYVDTPYGMVALRSLFTASLQGEESAGGIKAKLAELIEKEDKQNPLSDEALCRLLAAQQIQLSRRTVAKYRSQLGVPSASERKQRE